MSPDDPWGPTTGHDDPDDLDGYLTPTRRFVERVRGPLGFVLAVLLVVPLGAGLLQWLVFDRAGDRVVDQLEGDDLDAALVDSVLRVAATSCSGAGASSGTAFAMVLDGQVRLLTNRHVVEDARSVGLQELGGSPGPRVASWRVSGLADVAVLTLEDPGETPPALALADRAAEVGDGVRTVGFPSGLPFTTSGTVADLSGDQVLLDMEVSPGASGSPVLDGQGAVVAQVFARTNGGRGVATRAGTVVRALDDLGASRSDCRT